MKQNPCVTMNNYHVLKYHLNHLCLNFLWIYIQLTNQYKRDALKNSRVRVVV